MVDDKLLDIRIYLLLGNSFWEMNERDQREVCAILSYIMREYLIGKQSLSRYHYSSPRGEFITEFWTQNPYLNHKDLLPIRRYRAKYMWNQKPKL